MRDKKKTELKSDNRLLIYPRLKVNMGKIRNVVVRLRTETDENVVGPTDKGNPGRRELLVR